MPKPPYPKTGEWTKVGDRLWARQRGGVVRYYGDFRDFKAEGGKQERLVVPGEKLATTNRRVAETLLATRLKTLERLRLERERGRSLDVQDDVLLETFAREHLAAKTTAGKVTAQWLDGEELRLERAVKFFGATQTVASIKVAEVRRWAEHLIREGLSKGTVRQHLNSLSNLFRRAISDQIVPPHFNPVAAMMDKPEGRRAKPALWLEVSEAALYLEAARTYRPKRGDVAVPFAYPLIATFLLTGGRESEVLGLEVQDISFDRKTVTFRPNEWRRLKTPGAHRTIPLWPQLEAILRDYVFGSEHPPRNLLFPSFRTGQEAMLDDFRKVLDAVTKRASTLFFIDKDHRRRQVGKHEIRTKVFRHTYATARLQTTDKGKPVAPWTVAGELGHTNPKMIEQTYGHLGPTRHRAEVVEYHVKQHTKALKERLAVLRTSR